MARYRTLIEAERRKRPSRLLEIIALFVFEELAVPASEARPVLPYPEFP